MKTEDFERLKAVCDKEGFELLRSLPDKDTNFHILAVSKKDIWDGVEYGCWTQSDSEFFIKGKTYRFFNQFDHTYSEIGCQHFTNEVWVKSNFVPSTEQAYIEQLKKEAHERFGEIKEGDRFKFPNDGIDKVVSGSYEFDYSKETDRLYLGLVKLYDSGNWATRVKERVKVDHVGVDYSTWSGNVFFGFSFKGSQDIDKSGIGKFLASQLEKYLNGEVE